MKKSEVWELMQELIAAFPATNATVATAEVYTRNLVDLDVVRARKAVDSLICSSRFFPTVAEIRDAVTELRKNRTLAEAEADEAEEIRRYNASKGRKP